MALPRGTRLGPYEIDTLIGAGGMGEVYRASDTRLDRPVAIKILHQDGNPERLSRFEREAKAIAALTHPHICTVYDVGHHEGVDFLVMELLEGETLNARISKGPLPIAEALTCAIQIADALDKAHRHGVIHRDLKPANVLLTRSGAKLLDFGLAKLRSDGATLFDGPTKDVSLTAEGQILGTFAYMSPEQLEGKAVDARADIFAFGAIVFEMVTGQRAFEGSSQASLIGAVLHAVPPPLTRATPGAPPALERLVSVCLAKNPDDRWSTAHDVLLHLKGIAAASEPVAAPAAARRMRRDRVAYGIAAVALVFAMAMAALLLVGRSREQLEAPLDVLSVLPPPGTTLDHGEAPQVSPDGRRLALVATDASGRTAIYIRQRDSLVARALPDTDDASLPFWSPDSRNLGFFARGQLKTIPISGGSPHAIARAPLPRGGSWSREDVILFSAEPNAGPRRVPAAGGDATPVPVGGAMIGFRSFPTFLPDARHYLFLMINFGNVSGNGFPIMVGSLDSAETKELGRSLASPILAPGYLLYRRDVALVAQPFDPRALEFSGSPVQIAETLAINPLTSQGLFSVSNDGVLAYEPVAPGSQLVWFDRHGRRLDAAAPAADYNTVCLTSPDERIVYEQVDPLTASIDIWALDKPGAVPSRLTFSPSVDFYPVCTPTGADIIFASLREGPPNLFRQTVSAPGKETVVLRSPMPKIPNDVSRDGRLVVYAVLNQATNWDVEVMPLSGGPSQSVVATNAEEHTARLSPDGRWMAYISNASGTFEIYVQPFPATGAMWQVSKGGGHQPQWRRDGRELFYIAPGRKIVGVAVQTGTTFVPGEARVLVDTQITSWERSNHGSQYAPSADGERFLVNNATDTTLPITLVLNWTSALKK